MCLSAELGFVITSGESGSTDIYDDIAIDAAGNMYVSTNDQLIKYTPARSVEWSVNVPNAWDIELDGAGNIYASGPLTAPVTVSGVTGNVVLSSHGFTDVFLVKLNSSGQAVWGQAIGDSDDEEVGRIAVDSQGNAYVVGAFSGTLTVGSDTLVSLGSQDVFIARVLSSGSIQWARRMGSSEFDTAWGVGVDQAGNAYLTGSNRGAITLPTQAGSVTIPDPGASGAVYVAKVLATGDFAWGVGATGAPSSDSYSLKVDPAGFVVVYGNYLGPVDIDPGPARHTLPYMGTGSGGRDLFVLKLNLAGEFVWAVPLGGQASAQGMDMAIGPGGSIHLAGTFSGTLDFDPSGDAYNIIPNGSDAFVASLDSAGNFLAGRAWGGSSLDVAVGVVADPAGNLYVTGYFNALFDSADLDPGPGTHVVNSVGNADGFVLKLTPPTGRIGNWLWNDLNANGLQDVGEPGLAGAVVELYSTPDAIVGNSNDGRVGFVITDATGSYLFEQLASGNYFLKVHAPVGYFIPTANAGTDDSLNNDILPTGLSELIVLLPGEQRTDLDAALSGAAPDFGFAVSAGGTNLDNGIKVVTDAAGNSYVTGRFQGTVDFDGGAVVETLTSQGVDAYVAKYTPNGTLVWVRQLGGTSSDVGFDLVVDVQGNVYVVGQFSSSMDIDPGPILNRMTAGGSTDLFLIKLNDQGNLIYGLNIGGAGAESVGGLEFDPAGNLVIAGAFGSTVDFNPALGAGEVFQLTSAGNTDAFVLRLQPTGQFVSATKWGGSGLDFVNDLAVDARGVYTTGYFASTVDFDPATATSFPLTSAGSTDAFVSKLNADGSFAWAARHGTTNADQESFAIRVDSAGNVYNAGGFKGTVNFGGTPAISLTSFGDADGYLTKRSSTGEFLWIRHFGGSDQDRAYGLAVDGDDAVYVAGEFSPAARFGNMSAPLLMSSAGGRDAFVQKLTPEGEHVSFYKLGSVDVDTAFSVSLDSQQRMHVTGFFGNSIDFDPSAAVLTLNSQGAWDMFLWQSQQDSQQPRISLAITSVVENQGLQNLGPITVSGGATGETFVLQVTNAPPGVFSISGGKLMADTSLLDFESNTQVTLGIRAVGSAGHDAEQLFTLPILNANEKPTIAPLSNLATFPFAIASLSGSFTDPDAGDSWTATVDYGDGGGLQPLVILANQTFNLSHTYTAAGNFTATVIVTDIGGLSDTRTLQVAVTLFPLPVVGVSGSTAGVRGEPLTFQGSLTGQLPPGVNLITWNFGDGSPPISNPATGNWQVQQHAFAAVGNHTVTLTMTAGDGRTTFATTQVAVLSALVQVDPVDPTFTTLVVGGTLAGDMLRVVPAGANRLNVWLRTQLIGSYVDMDRVVLYGQGGNDFILGAASGNVDFWFFGGDGDDRLIGGAGNDVLLGEAGNDFAWGAGGRDLLAGGQGADVLTAKADDDLLIAGDLVLINMQAGLADIMREWTSPRTFVDRVNNLKGDLVGPHDNGNTLLVVSQTVLGDGEVDSLWGGSTNDWFFANSSVDRVEDHWFNDLVDDLTP